MFSHVVTFLLILLPSGQPSSAHASESGDLTVTAVVASSASVTFDSDGRSVLVVANAPADADTIVLASKQFDRPNSTPKHKILKASAGTTKSKSKGAKYASTR